MAPPRSRYGAAPSPWQTSPGQGSAWGASAARSPWAQPTPSWQSDRGVFSDPYAHSHPADYPPAYSRPDPYDPYAGAYAGYGAPEYPSLFPPAASYAPRPLPMLAQSRPNFKRPSNQNKRPQQQKQQPAQTKKKPVQKQSLPVKSQNKGGKAIKTGSGGENNKPQQQQQKKEQPKPRPQQKNGEPKDPVVLCESDPVDKFLETSKGISESRRKQIRFKVMRLFSYNGIQMRTVTEQPGTFSKRGDIHMKIFFSKFFPEIFEISATGNDVDDVAYDLIVQLVNKLHEFGILEKKVIVNLASKKHGYKHELYNRGKLCIAVMKEELEKEEFDSEFRDGTRNSTPEESETLQAALKRAADRISNDDLPKDERAKPAEDEPNDDSAQLEEEIKEEDIKSEEKEEYELTDEV
ncbi:unnamed protein product [Bursaphelenchus xylophilus]|uniref:(pine wood nematode) hypothetical protein n=1 Tax=Bursaphelenchus xylophilus TaxID=6326 RepID=A0A1I7RX00_BURXY|nr:unnamed protein product [Bursaphelenchus xylophilus]CAG9121234.1 unnamed protein product [Bursaphelenchus xylophilus]